MINFFETTERENKYYSMLRLMACLSNLFSESEIPFIHYRITENLFCKYSGAVNLSRTDTAYDAKRRGFGIGIKTFTIPGNSSKEKIAEFNALSSELREINGLKLARKLADFRNERMLVANSLYGINSSFYHIIGRKNNSLHIFNTPYDFVDKENIIITKSNDKGLHFTDGKNEYSFNRSKSVLMKRFNLPEDAHIVEVEIIKDPFILLENLISDINRTDLYKPKEQILLPLFSQKKKTKWVPEKSGLNQWNASGRPRNENEVYVPIPASVHKERPDFFPDRNTVFTLMLPDGSEMDAKVCQAGGKALMSNPNSKLGEWLLRKILRITPGCIVTYQDLAIAGFDSLVITKYDDLKFGVEVSRESSFIYQ